MVKPLLPLTDGRLRLEAIDHRRVAYESGATSLPALAHALAARLPDDEPYTLFGHSLGGLLAVECVHLLATLAGPLPSAVIVAGSRPPHCGTNDLFAPLVDLPDEPFLAALVQIGAISAELADSPFRPLMLPGLRADLRLIANHGPQPWHLESPLPVPLHAWHAPADPLAPPQLARGWARYTTREFRIRLFGGDHLFPSTRPAEVAQALGEVVLPTESRVARHHRPAPGSNRRREASPPEE